MEHSVYYKSVLDQDETPIVICDLEHTIIYMNDTAIGSYAKWGGKELLGRNLLDCHDPRSGEMIKKVVEHFRKDEGNNIVYTFYNEKENKDVYMVALRDEDKKLIGYYEKHRLRNREENERYKGII